MLAANTLAALMLILVSCAHALQDRYKLVHKAYRGTEGDVLRATPSFVINSGQCSGVLYTNWPVICGRYTVTSLEVTGRGYSGNHVLEISDDLSQAIIRRRACAGPLFVTVRVACAAAAPPDGAYAALPPSPSPFPSRFSLV